MFSFFKNKNIDHNNDEDIFSKVASLLIHIAKIDQNYTAKEKEIVIKTILELGAKKKILKILLVLQKKMKAILIKFWNLLKKLKIWGTKIKKKLLRHFGQLFI